MKDPGGRVFRFGGFELEAAEYRLTRAGIEVPLRPKPFETLLHLVERHGHLVEKSELLETIWTGTFVGEGALTRCIKEVRQALGDDAREPRYIRTRSGIGYTFIGDVEEVGSDRTPGSGEAAGSAGARRSSRWAIPALAGMLIALVALVVWQRVGREPELSDGGTAGAPVERTMIAVLPFENLGPEGEAYFAVGMSDEIMTRLAALRELGVISHTTVFQYDTTGKTVREIGADLNVDFILEGSVLWERGTEDAGRVRITPQLIRVSDDSHVWAHSYERVVDEVFEVQSEIASEVARHLGITFGESAERDAAGRPTENLNAYRAYLLGRYHAGQPHFTVDNWRRVIGYYEEAVELDPEFGLAWAELARAHSRFYFLKADLSEERRRQAAQAVDQAVSLAPDSVATRTALGYYTLWVEGDSKRALRELQGVERRRPNDAEVLAAVATLLRSDGHWAEAERSFERAFELSPRDPLLALELAYVYWPTRQYEKALEACDQTNALLPDPAWRAWPNLTKAFTYWTWGADLAAAREALEAVPPEHEWSTWAWFWQEVFEGEHDAVLARLAAIPDGWIRIKIVARPASLLAAMVHGLRGDEPTAEAAYGQALQILEAAVRDHPDDPRLQSSLGIALAAAGRKDDAIRAGQHAVELFPMSKDAFYGAPQVIDLAHIYALLGEDEAALDEIEYLLRVPSWFSPAWLEMDPRWNTLRGQPRFEELLAEQ
jgi:TolB-like protein/DNA-binding winged helix-turn-helix (wHTH) protein/Flp pilus assembly protein TadD